MTRGFEVTETSALSIVDLVVRFITPQGVIDAVRGLTLELRQGETLGLLGQSGSGKSMIAWSILGLIPRPGRIERGEVRLFGRDLLKAKDEELRKIRGGEIGFIVPNARAHLNPLIPVGKQIADVYRSHNHVSKREASEAAVAILRSVAIPDPKERAKSYPHELSGGMTQRVVIAMATINSPRVLIADEPTMGLDVTIQAQVLELLAEQVHQLGASTLLITRDLGIAARYCDRIGVLHDGRLVEVSDARGFFSSPRHPFSADLLRSSAFRGSPSGPEGSTGVAEGMDR